MMIRLTIYILRSFVPWLAIALGAAVLVFVSTQLVRVAPVFFGTGAGPTDTAAALALLLVPVITWALTPAFAVAAFALAGQMSEEGELLVLDAAGLGRPRALAALVALIALLTCASAWLWLVAGPASQARLHTIAVELAGSALSRRMAPGAFTELVPGITFFFEERTEAGFERIMLEDARDPQSPAQLVAVRGRTAFDPGQKSLTIHLEKGTGFWGAGTRIAPQVALSFAELDLQLPILAAVTNRLEFLPAVMAVPTAELAGPAPSWISPVKWRFALWRRIAGPIAFGLLSGLCLYLAFGATWRRRGRAIAAAVGVFGLFHLTGRLAESLMQGGLLSAPQAALGPLCLAGVSLMGLSAVAKARFKYAKIVPENQI